MQLVGQILATDLRFIGPFVCECTKKRNEKKKKNETRNIDFGIYFYGTISRLLRNKEMGFIISRHFVG